MPKTKRLHPKPSTSKPANIEIAPLAQLAPLRQLTQRGSAMAQGDFDALGQPLDFEHKRNAAAQDEAIEGLRRVMDVMGEHLRQAQHDIHDYVNMAQVAQENERGRLARELHDETVQQLIALGQGIERAQGLIRHDPDQAIDKLKAVRAQTTALVQSLRGLIANLRPPALDELGLVAAVKLMVSREATQPKPDTRVVVRGQVRRLDGASELALFRIIQEAWTNIVKHAGAARASITLAYNQRQFVITLKDDGKGFAPESVGAGHWGLVGMRERAGQLNGLVNFESLPGQGTTTIIRVPYLGLAGRDPVCGMQVGPEGLTAEYSNTRYRFCSEACRMAFRAEPQHYLMPQTV